EQIIQEDGKDAEAHWCAALSRFGIEYVEDPATLEYLPTCHRASFDSFLDDIDVKAAIDNSDGLTKRQYQKDALKIEEVRQGILATSSKEDPFDIFICYKETDQNGGRTPDSVLAQDIYDRLMEKGYKVFFSRITLEDRVGTEYEPFIFAALNSAKAMIVVGTSKENLESVWVKNEWSRFLALMKKDRNKVILPCYKDMDPYDMPEALSVLQSYNMASIGFVQDLIRGIDKIIPKSDSNTGNGKTDGGFDINAYKKRAEDFLRNGDFKNAVSYSEKILDLYPECTEAYLIELCAAAGVCKKEDLSLSKRSFGNEQSYMNLLKYGSSELVKEIESYLSIVENRIKKKKKTVGLVGILVTLILAAGILVFIWIQKDRPYRTVYDNAIALMNKKDYSTAIDQFSELNGYKDSLSKVDECSNLLYEEAVTNIKNREYYAAMTIFDHLLDLGCLENSDEVVSLYNDCYYAYYNDVFMNNNTDEVAKTLFEGLGNMKLPRDEKCENLCNIALRNYSQVMNDEAESIPRIEATCKNGMIVLSVENLTNYNIKKATISYVVYKNGNKGNKLIDRAFFVENIAPHETIYVDTNEKGPGDSDALSVEIEDYDITYEFAGMEIVVR
ncbi:MAG: toll/interleukin-1 receptor domain-containing protein, partial [Lachnospiraceae bacterium]|nr:toll/interleukin-1 receptor domain-containing protein [Lachnospiraceae bacterium]